MLSVEQGQAGDKNRYWNLPVTAKKVLIMQCITRVA